MSYYLNIWMVKCIRVLYYLLYVWIKNLNCFEYIYKIIKIGFWIFIFFLIDKNNFLFNFFWKIFFVGFVYVLFDV